MLTAGRNRNAEMAFEMAVKLLGGSTALSEARLTELWDTCHSNTELQDSVSLYLASSSDYAPKALHKLHTKLAEVFG